MSRTPGLAPRGLVAPLLRWALWSPRRVLTIAVSALAATVVLTHISSIVGFVHPAAPPASTPVAAPPTVRAPATTIPVPAPSDSASAPTTPVVAARTFATYWVDHINIDPALWLARLRPLSSDEYGATILSTVDPATVPASRVTGAARLLRSVNRTATVRVPLDGLAIDIALVDTTGRGHWVVNEVNPAEGGAR